MWKWVSGMPSAYRFPQECQPICGLVLLCMDPSLLCVPVFAASSVPCLSAYMSSPAGGLPHVW